MSDDRLDKILKVITIILVCAMALVVTCGAVMLSVQAVSETIKLFGGGV